MRVSPIFALHDLWIGAFWDAKKRWLYLLPIPCCGIILKFGSQDVSPGAVEVDSFTLPPGKYRTNI